MRSAAAAAVLSCALFASSCTPDRREAVLPAEPVSYTIEESSISLEDKYIYGRLCIPEDGKNTHPVVILCHGMGVNHSHTMNFAMMFAEHGIAAYAFDFCGGGDPSQSSGTMAEMSVHTELEDLNDVLAHIKDTGIAGRNPVFVLGMSQGGYVAAEAAARQPDEIAGLLLFFPAFNINDLILAEYPSEEDVPAQGSIFDQTVSRKYFLDAMHEPITEDMEAYAGPVLILHGSEDAVVPCSYSETAAAHYPNAELHLIEGAGHGFFLQDADTALSYCLPFLSRIIAEQR